MATPDYNDYILFLETVHGNVLKSLSESLKDLISDVNITFNHKTFGIRHMHDAQTFMIYLTMFAEEFDEYYILEPFVAGVSIPLLYKALKTLSTGDVLRLMITKSDPNTLVVFIVNSKDKQFIELDVPLIDINEEDDAVPPEVDFTFMVTMDSNNFQSIIRNLKNIGVENVYVTYSKEGLEFKGKGEMPVRYLLKQGENKLEIVTKTQAEKVTIYQAIFEVEKLFKFTKCTNLSDTVKILLLNDYPIVFISDAGGQGDLKFFLAPANPEN